MARTDTPGPKPLGFGPIGEGHRIFYEREVPFELRSADGTDAPQEVGALEAIRVKVLVVGEENAYVGTRGALRV